MAVCSDGSYGVPEGLISSFPVTIADGRWAIVQGLEINDFSQARIDKTVAELEEEREAVKGLGLLPEPGSVATRAVAAFRRRRLTAPDRSAYGGSERRYAGLGRRGAARGAPAAELRVDRTARPDRGRTRRTPAPAATTRVTTSRACVRTSMPPAARLLDQQPQDRGDQQAAGR